MSTPDSGTGSIFWREPAPLVLGSGSSTRRQLLTACGIPIRILKPEVDEATLANSLLSEKASPKTIAMRLANAKSDAIRKLAPNDLVLTADQTLDHQGELFMKPASVEQARTQLKELRASTHQLHSAAVLCRGDKIIWSGVASARLVMRDFSDAFLEIYIAAIGPTLLETVGGYQIEGLGLHLFAEISGQHATILGLPLIDLLEALRNIGAITR